MWFQESELQDILSKDRFHWFHQLCAFTSIRMNVNTVCLCSEAGKETCFKEWFDFASEKLVTSKFHVCLWLCNILASSFKEFKYPAMIYCQHKVTYIIT